MEKPTNVRIVAAGPLWISLSWTAPNETYGNISSYTVVLMDRGTLGGVAASAITASTNVNLTGLSLNTTYEIIVMAAATKLESSREELGYVSDPIYAITPSGPGKV